MRRSGPLRRRKALRRQGRLERRTPLRRLTPLRRTPVSRASPAQRAKVRGRACIACGSTRLVDPAHITPRSRGGCDAPDCAVALCRFPCHRGFDRGELDLLPHLEPEHRAELAHALTHLSLLALLRRVTGVRWAAVATEPDPREDYDD